ncbi:MAG: hypothetical protein HQ518_01810 [Rhodopirellula sp.]|nr:hypothetical protein [Rhodopirellula sp.]
MDTRVKCPVCGELLSAETAQPALEPADAAATAPREPTSSTPRATAGDAAGVPKAAASPDETRASSKPAQRPPTMANSSHLHAKGGFLFVGLPMPSFFAESSVTLLPERVRLKLSGPFSTRRLDLRLSAITSAETRRTPAWYLLPIGTLLLPANGVGLIFLAAFLFVRHSFLILRAGSATFALRIDRDDTAACAVADAILQAAQSSTPRSP